MTGYDKAFADVRTSTDDAFVEYDAEPNDDGSEIMIRRTVWRRAYRTKDRNILWQSVEVQLSRDEAQDLVRDLVMSLSVRQQA